MKRLGFGKIVLFAGLKGLLHTTGVQIPPKFLDYLTGYRWGAPAVLSYKCIDVLID
jgi:hypothetical protein